MHQSPKTRQTSLPLLLSLSFVGIKRLHRHFRNRLQTVPPPKRKKKKKSPSCVTTSSSSFLLLLPKVSDFSPRQKGKERRKGKGGPSERARYHLTLGGKASSTHSSSSSSSSKNRSQTMAPHFGTGGEKENLFMDMAAQAAAEGKAHVTTLFLYFFFSSRFFIWQSGHSQP